MRLLKISKEWKIRNEWKQVDFFCLASFAKKFVAAMASSKIV